MAERLMSLPKGVRWNSAWPLTEMPKAPRSKGEWTLAISINKEAPGLVVFYPSDEAAPEVVMDDGTIWGKRVTFRPFYRVGSARDAERFCVNFCSQGHHEAEALKEHQDGIMWGFNWVSLTLATVKIAGQVADHLFNDRYDEAWSTGKKFGASIRIAENAAYAAAR